MPTHSKWGEWHLNPCLETLCNELRLEYPGITIWSIGDANHKPPSDHLPNKAKRVNALDIPITKKFLRTNVDHVISVLQSDSRVKYIIFNRRIWKKTTGWKPYNGSNPHTSHVHGSVVDSSYKNAGRWGIGGKREVVFTNILGYLPTLQINDRGPVYGDHYITRAQIMLNYLVPEEIVADDHYGPKTANAVKKIMGDKYDGAVINSPVWAKLYAIKNNPRQSV